MDEEYFPRCKAVTKSGTRCCFRATRGERCKMHDHGKSKCAGITKSGKACPNEQVIDGYCTTHYTKVSGMVVNRKNELKRLEAD